MAVAFLRGGASGEPKPADVENEGQPGPIVDR